MSGDWKKKFFQVLEIEINSVLNKQWEYSQLQNGSGNVNFVIKAGGDSLTLAKEYAQSNFVPKWDLLITSPPYLQAQEYIRASKMDLLWLGFSEEQIRELGRQELPYKRIEPLPVYSQTFDLYRKNIKERHLLQMFENYFYSVIGVLENASKLVSNRLCIFVGQASIRGKSVPIDQILAEHFDTLNEWQYETTLIDTIVARVMFRS